MMWRGSGKNREGTIIKIQYVKKEFTFNKKRKIIFALQRSFLIVYPHDSKHPGLWWHTALTELMTVTSFFHRKVICLQNNSSLSMTSHKADWQHKHPFSSSHFQLKQEGFMGNHVHSIPSVFCSNISANNKPETALKWKPSLLEFYI